MNSSFLNRFQYLPIIGCCLFLFLISMASYHFPGGSQAENCALGYSWVNNYLCDVIAIEAYNGDAHPYSKIGLAAMMCLCGAISMFFFFFTDWMEVKGRWRFIIKWMGLVSMICAMLIFTELHNIMIAISSILALPALLGVFIILYRKKLFPFFYAGILILLLLLLNNVIYYTQYMEECLPQIQKISVLCVVFWIVVMNWKMVKVSKLI